MSYSLFVVYCIGAVQLYSPIKTINRTLSIVYTYRTVSTSATRMVSWFSNKTVIASSCLWEGACLIYVVCVQRCPTHIVLCVCLVCLRLVYPILPVSLDCPFLIAPSVFYNNCFYGTPCNFHQIDAKEYTTCSHHSLSFITIPPENKIK